MFSRFAYTLHSTTSFAILLVNTTPFPFGLNTSWETDSGLRHKLLDYTLSLYHHICCFHNISTDVSYLLCIVRLDEHCRMAILTFFREFWKASLKSLVLNVITRHYTVTSTMRSLGRQNTSTFSQILRMFQQFAGIFLPSVFLARCCTASDQSFIKSYLSTTTWLQTC